MLKVPRGTTGANREPLFLKGVKTSLELHEATYLFSWIFGKKCKILYSYTHDNYNRL